MMKMLCCHSQDFQEHLHTSCFCFCKCQDQEGIHYGLTITFYNYVTRVIYIYIFLAEIRRSNTAKPIIYNSQMMKTKIFAAKQ